MLDFGCADRQTNSASCFQHDSKLNDSPPNANGDRLCAITGAEFLHDVLEVSFNGFFRDKQLVGDVPIAVPPAS